MADVNFVQGLYRNVLARDPDAEGANYWNSQIANGATHDEVTVAFLNSVEAQTVINPVVRLYEGLLNRAPDVDGLKYWADALRGGRSLNDITNDFLNSPEAIENGFDPDPNNLSDEAFVTKLYEAMGRTPEQIAADTDGVQYWLNALNTETMSRAQVAQGFMESAENQQDTDGFVTGWGALRAAGNPGPTTTQLEDFSTEVVFVDSLYRNVLARDPDAGANAEVAQIASGATHDQVKVAFLNSTETQTVINPVVRLYEGLLNRAPDVDGLKYWADALRGGRSLNDITNDFLNSPEGIAKGFGDDIGNATFVNNLYLSMGRDQAQIDADSDGVSFWLNALNTETMSRAQVAQGFMESAENQQDTDGFVTGWGALRAAGNPGPTTAQLDNFSDTATTAEIIASADTVGASADWPTGAGASPYPLSGTAASLAAADPRLLNGATNITVTGTATVAQAIAIEAATNAGTTIYNISDTSTAIGGASATVLNGATSIDADGPVTLTGAQVTDDIVAKFHSSDDLTLSASGAVLSALSGTTLGDADVVALNASDNAATLTGAQVADAIIAKFDASDDLTLNAAGTALSGLTAAALGDADVVALNASDNAVTLTGAQVTAAIIGKFAADDQLTLNGTAATLLPFAADPKVVGLDATDAVTLSGEQVTAAIIGKFAADDQLTLNGTAATLLPFAADPKVVGLNASDNNVTLTGAQVTDAIIAKFHDSDNLTLNATGAQLSGLLPATLADADVVAINATNATVAQLGTIDAAATATITYSLADTGTALGDASEDTPTVLSGATNIDVTGDGNLALYDSGVGDGRLFDDFIAKFATDDHLTLNAEFGTTLSALSLATLSSGKVAVLDAYDNLVTLTDAKVTSTIVDKFSTLDDHLTLNAPGETLSLLSVDALDRPNMTLNATSGAITLTALQFDALDISTSVIDASDPFTIMSDPGANMLDLNGAGGGAATVVFAALPTSPDDISNFTAGTDKLAFSAATFIGLSGLGPIDTSEFLVAADVSAAGGTGFTGDHRFLYNDGGGANAGDLFYDADGSGAGVAVQIATMQTVTALEADDIIMI